MNKNTIFARYFTTCALIIIFSFVVLGAVLLSVVWNYNISQTEERLSRDAAKVSALINLSVGNDSPFCKTFCFPASKFLPRATKPTSSSQTAKGKSFSPVGDEEVPISAAVGREFLDPVVTGGVYKGIGSLGGLYEGKVATVGVPIKTSGSLIIGGVFASSNTPYMGGFFLEFSGSFAFSAVMVLLFAFAVIYVLTLRYRQPHQKNEHGRETVRERRV
jgi:hypothetical protein